MSVKSEDKLRRNTRQKEIVLEEVRSRFDHPSASEIYLSVREKDPRISKGTVYRNLKELSRTGLINHIPVPGADRYDVRVDRHYHIMCLSCGSVEDVPVDYEKELDFSVDGKNGYIVRGHQTVFEGICPQCQRSVSAATHKTIF